MPINFLSFAIVPSFFCFEDIEANVSPLLEEIFEILTKIRIFRPQQVDTPD